MVPNGIDDLCICGSGQVVCTCRVQSPPLQPTLTLDQLRFIRIHQIADGSEYVEQWREVFGGATIHAKTNRGKVATIAKFEADALVTAGLLGKGWDQRSFYVTDLGRKI